MSKEKIKLDMNGYRDPKTVAEERRARLEALDLDRLFGRVDAGGGGGGGEAGERECGYREEGGVYAEVPLSRAPDAKPLEHFFACPPFKVDPLEYGLHPKGFGVKVIDLPEACETCAGSWETIKLPTAEIPGDGYQKAGTCSVCGGLGLVPVAHVFDTVGAGNYPNVADFLEEARRLGVSRRLELEPNDYARLTPRSRLVILHPHAVIENPKEYYAGMGELELARLHRAGCPKFHPQHDDFIRHIDPALKPSSYDPPRCAALWYHDLEQGTHIQEQTELEDTLEEMVADEVAGRFVERRLVSCTYRGYSRPEGVKPEYSLGICAVFPLVQIVVIDSEGNYPHKLERASKASVPVEVKDC